MLAEIESVDPILVRQSSIEQNKARSTVEPIHPPLEPHCRVSQTVDTIAHLDKWQHWCWRKDSSEAGTDYRFMYYLPVPFPF